MEGTTPTDFRYAESERQCLAMEHCDYFILCGMFQERKEAAQSNGGNEESGRQDPFKRSGEIGG